MLGPVVLVRWRFSCGASELARLSCQPAVLHSHSHSGPVVLSLSASPLVEGDAWTQTVPLRGALSSTPRTRPPPPPPPLPRVSAVWTRRVTKPPPRHRRVRARRD